MEFVIIKTDLMRCRACFIEMNTCEMVYIYDKVREPNLSNIFIQCTSIKISESDDLPAFICADCNGLLIQWNDFRQTCQTSDKQFREQKLKTENKIKIESPIEKYDDSAVVVDGKDFNNKRSAISLLKLEIEDQHQNLPADFEAANDFFDDRDDSQDDSDDLQVNERNTEFNNSERKEIVFFDIFYCDMCDKKFYKKPKLEAHLRQHVGYAKPYLCNYCDKSYKKWSSIVKHTKNKHSNKLNDDDNVNGKVSNNHTKMHCDLCGHMFYNKLILEGHLREHQGLKKFVCKICNKDFPTIKYLNNHFNSTHNTFENIYCRYSDCNKQFKAEPAYKAHLRNCHLKVVHSNPSYDCNVCGRTLPNRFRLKEHSYIHSGEKPFSCNRCPNKYTTKSSLKVHLMRHDNIRNFVCPICGIKRTTNRELTTHINSHTKEKTWTCSKCPVISTSYNSSRRHFRKVHLGIVYKQPYPCEHCDRTFSNTVTLRNHTLIHTIGQRPHICTICDKRFVRLCNLTQHKKTHDSY